MLIPQKVNVVFDPLSSGIGAGRLELLGIEEKQRISLVKTILSSATEFIATTIVTAGLGAVFQTTKAVAQTTEGLIKFASAGSKGIYEAIGAKFTEAAIASSKFAVSSTLVQTTSGAIQGESAEDIVKEVTISAAVITGVSFAQAAVKASKVAKGLKKTSKLLEKYEKKKSWFEDVEAIWRQGSPELEALGFKQPSLYKAASKHSNIILKELEDELMASVTKIKLKVERTIIEDIIGTTLGKELKGIDSLQSLALSKLKLSALRKLLKKGAKGNARINKLYQATNRIAKKQKALEKKIIKQLKIKLNLLQIFLI